MSDPAPAVAVLVVDYGSHALLAANLAPLDLPGNGVRVVVADNHRSDADSRALADLAARCGWDLLAMGRNAGFGAAMNAAADAAMAAGAQALLVLNPDVAIDVATVKGLTDAVRADPSAMVSPRIVRPDGRVWFAGGHVDLDAGRTRSTAGPDGPRTPPWLSGACLALHADLWRATGGFAEDYFLYWEDVDLSFRALRAGAKLLVEPDLEVVHDVGGTQHESTARAKSPVYYEYNVRNRLVFAAHHLQRRDRWRWLLGTPADARRVLLRGGRRQFLNPGRTVLPAVRGAVSGTRVLLASGGGR